MFSAQAIKHQAVMMGIRTGQMPDVEFIWSIQQSEGLEMCFGQGIECNRMDCRWKNQCKALNYYSDSSVVEVI